MNLNRSELVKRVSETTGRPVTEIRDTLELMLAEITGAMACGEDVLLTHFGKFVVKHKKARPGRNPKTGEIKTIQARRIVTLKFADAFKNTCNKTSHLARREGNGEA